MPHDDDLARWPGWVEQHLEGPLGAICERFDLSLTELGEELAGSRLPTGAVYCGVEEADQALDELRAILDRACVLARQARQAIERDLK